MLRNIVPVMDFGQSYSNWGILLLWQTHPFYEVAITGEKFQEEGQALQRKYFPNKITLGAHEKSSLDLLQGKFQDETTIFVCQNKTCQQPVSQISLAMDQMKP